VKIKKKNPNRRGKRKNDQPGHHRKKKNELSEMDTSTQAKGSTRKKKQWAKSTQKKRRLVSPGRPLYNCLGNDKQKRPWVGGSEKLPAEPDAGVRRL